MCVHGYVCMSAYTCILFTEYFWERIQEIQEGGALWVDERKLTVCTFKYIFAICY